MAEKEGEIRFKVYSSLSKSFVLSKYIEQESCQTEPLHFLRVIKNPHGAKRIWEGQISH